MFSFTYTLTFGISEFVLYRSIYVFYWSSMKTLFLLEIFVDDEKNIRPALHYTRWREIIVENIFQSHGEFLWYAFQIFIPLYFSLSLYGKLRKALRIKYFSY